MKTRLDLLTLNKPDGPELASSWKDILHVGIPAAGTNAIIPIATGVIEEPKMALMGFGNNAVIAIGGIFVIGAAHLR